MRNLEELSWGEVRRLGHGGALFLIPVGPLEDHGPHLPAGVDMLLSLGFCRDLATSLEARVPGLETVILPPLAMGSSRLRSLGCVRVTDSTLRRAVEQMGHELALEGVRYSAVISAHLAAGHIAALERASHRVSRRGRLKMIAPAGKLAYQLFTGALKGRMEEALGRALTPDEAGCIGFDLHAGAVETSLMMRFRPELVADFFRELPPHRVTPDEIMKGLGRSLRTHRGYFGDPALATPDLGKALGDAIVGEGVDLLARFVRGENVQTDSEFGLRKVPWMARDEARINGLLMGLAAGLAAGFALGRLRRT